MKLVTVVGARPQFIKSSTVSRVLACRTDVKEVLIHTGQHYDKNMSDVFFDELGLRQPDYCLGIGGGPHGQMTGRQLEAIEAVLIAERPDCVLVYGDTNSTLAGALAAAKLHIPIAHVEAGVRSFNKSMPEELNRIITDHVSATLFAPSERAVRNLHSEGINGDRVRLVGDVMLDALLFYKARAKRPDGLGDRINLTTPFVLATVHRAENTDDRERLSGIIDGLSRSGAQVVLPLHPRTRSKIDSFSIDVPENVFTIPPVSYLEMIWLEANCAAIATDSGGIQKEAHFLAKPCVTLRDETEWVELLELDSSILVGANAELIAEGLQRAGSSKLEPSLYGDGTASEKIVRMLLS